VGQLDAEEGCLDAIESFVVAHHDMVALPALARRPDDILALAEHFLGNGRRLDEAARHALARHPWPGNVRELKNVIHRAFVLSDEEVQVDIGTFSALGQEREDSGALATMGYKHHALDVAPIHATLTGANFLLKIVPHVDGTARICELVRYYCEDVTVKGAWSGPAALQLFHHALAPVAQLPVLEIVSGVHIVSDLTLGLGTVIHDYLS